VKTKVKFPKNLISAAIIGLGLGSILWLISSGLDAVIAAFPPNAGTIFFLIGFAIPIALALNEDTD